MLSEGVIIPIARSLWKYRFVQQITLLSPSFKSSISLPLAHPPAGCKIFRKMNHQHQPFSKLEITESAPGGFWRKARLQLSDRVVLDLRSNTVKFPQVVLHIVLSRIGVFIQWLFEAGLSFASGLTIANFFA